MPLSLTNPSGRRLNANHLLWLGVFLLCTLLQVIGMVPEMRYVRHLVAGDSLWDHQWWRMFSAQLVHIDWPHWFLNMAGVAIVGFFFSAYDRVPHWLLVLAVSVLFTGVGIHLFNPEVSRYVGLSGALHGLFIYGALREISRYPTSGIVLLIVLIAKLLYEQFVGVMPYTEQMTVGKVIVDSHLYGAVGGVVAYVVTVITRSVAAKQSGV